MRNLFSWRLRPSDADFTQLWENATFVFDTNFLLDLYRVSRSTSEDFLRILERLQDRIWLPYQVASEFLNRREEIIDSEATSFQKALSALVKWKDEQRSFVRLRGLLADAGRIVASEVAFLFDNQDAYLSAIDDIEKCFREKVEELANSHSPLNSEEDYILENLLSLFDGKVGEPYDMASMGKLYQEGADRYSKEIPPGFKDAKEKEDERKYGDFILWKQILDFANVESCSIIFVTGEKKEDWWIKKGGETVSPRLELRREFQEQVKQPFWMYRTQRFLELAKEKLTVEIHPRSIEETNAIANVESAEEQAYENLRRAIEQFETPTLNENLRRAIEQFETPTLNENLRRAIEQFQTPTLNENLRRAIEQFQTPMLNENLRRAIEQAQTPSSEVRHLENHNEEPHDKPSSLTGKEDAEVESPFNALEKKDSEPINEGENQGQENASPITDESQEESKEASPKPKKRSSSRKHNENNPRKSK